MRACVEVLSGVGGDAKGYLLVVSEPPPSFIHSFTYLFKVLIPHPMCLFGL